MCLTDLLQTAWRQTRFYPQYCLLFFCLLSASAAFSQAPAYLQKGPFATKNADLLEYMNKQRPAVQSSSLNNNITPSADKKETGRTLTRQEIEQLEKEGAAMQYGILQAYQNKQYDEVVEAYPDFVGTSTFGQLRPGDKLSFLKMFLEACANSKGLALLKKGYNQYSSTVTSYRDYKKKAVELYTELLYRFNAYKEAAEAYEEAGITDVGYFFVLLRLNDQDRLRLINCNSLYTSQDMCLYYRGMAWAARGAKAVSQQLLKESASMKYGPAILELFYQELGNVSQEESRKRLQQYLAGTSISKKDHIQAQLTYYLMYEEWSAAKHVVDSLVRTDPKEALPWFLHAMIARNENRDAVATASFIKANSLEPDSEDILKAAAGFFSATGQEEKLDALCRQTMRNAKEQKTQVRAGYELARWYGMKGKSTAETCQWLQEAKAWKIDSADHYLAKYCSTLLSTNHTLEELLSRKEGRIAILKIKNNPELLKKPVTVDSVTSSVLSILLLQKDTLAIRQLLEMETPVLPMHETDRVPLLMAWASMPLDITLRIAEKGGLEPGMKINRQAAAPYFKGIHPNYTGIARFLFYSVAHAAEVGYGGKKQKIDSLLPLLKCIPAGTIIEDEHTIYDMAMIHSIPQIIAYYAAQPGHPWYKFTYYNSYQSMNSPGYEGHFANMLRQLHGKTDESGNTFAHLFLYKLYLPSGNDLRWYLNQLKANGFDLKQKNSEGKTPLDMGLMNRFIKESKTMRKILKEAIKE